jgi:hypothetical protein
MVLLESIVEEVYGENRRQQQQLFRQSPFSFLAGLASAIEKRIQDCEGKVPIITGMNYSTTH